MKIIFSWLIVLFLIFPINIFGGDLPLVIEAELGDLGSDFEVLEEEGITFVRPKTDFIHGSYPGDLSKIISFQFNFEEPGEYHFYAKIRIGPGTWDDDSFFLAKNFGDVSATNAGDWHIVNGLVQVGHISSFEIVTGSGNVGEMVWKWVNISKFLNAQAPISYQVEDTERTYTFSIGSREDNFDIDKIAFASANLDYTVGNLELIEPGAPIGGFPDEAYRKVLTYINPVLPGAHPDKTLMRLGDDFYSTGSSFHITPYIPIYHSTDLVHWEIISRVVPADWTGSINDSPAGGIWQGALAEFGGYFWVYYSINSQQYFSKATSMRGPWSLPTRVTGSTVTGYDNSIFVDDDGTPYMLMKNGKWINRMQKIDIETGQLTGPLMNLDWINAEEAYSWAEGPVMCKRDGWYYYFIAGNVGGGQWVLRTSKLTDDPEYWEELGPFFMTTTDPAASLRAPNHVTQPVEIADGTWWALSQSFESLSNDNWEGKGRQGSLHQVVWDENGKPYGTAPTSLPQLKPDLPKSGISWNLPRSDYFDDSSLKLTWYFLNRSAASKYSLNERNGWLSLDPGKGHTHILHKEGAYYFTLTTKLELNATSPDQQAGLYITNGNESLTAKVYSGYNNGKKIGISFVDKQTNNEIRYELDNNIGNDLWLMLKRDYHEIRGYFSNNGITWTQIGEEISTVDLDKSQPEYNWWIGNSNGLFASGKKALFDLYIYRDGFFEIPVTGFTNYFGVEEKSVGNVKAVTNVSDKGGWLMLGGIDLGKGFRIPASVEVSASSTAGGTLEIWIDDIEEEGSLIAEIDITNTGGESLWKDFSADVTGVSGQHDLYLRWNGQANAYLIKSLKFNFTDSYLTKAEELNLNELSGWNVFPNPFENYFVVESAYPESEYRLYTVNGNLIKQGLINDNNMKIDCSGFYPGVYLLELRSDENTSIIKLLMK